MARKTFISYKYSDARGLRDRIIAALGDDATYYKGEDGYSDDLSSFKAETIKEYLKDMLFDTTVTIVAISPEMLQSKWIDWEIEYSLREYTRNGISSSTNGVVGVIMNDWSGETGWIKTNHSNADGCRSVSYDESKLFRIINNNRFNQTPKEYACETCGTVDALNGSYISLVDEDDFLSNPSKYIDNAFEKSRNLWNYDLCKTR